MVVVKGDERNKAQWKLEIITEVYPEGNGKVKAVRLIAGKSYLERTIQYFYQLEVSCDITTPTQEYTINADAADFRQKRNGSEGPFNSSV